MPNHITNKLTISGQSNLIEEIIGSDIDTDQDDYQLDFKRTVPYPPEADSENGFDWYNWHCNNWGTKWNANETSIISINENSAEIIFQTAWSPPRQWFERTIELYPSLDFRLSWYDEDYPNSGILNKSNGVYTNKYFGYEDEAKQFMKEEWPDVYQMYENDRAIDDLETELNEYIHEFYPNAKIKISDYEANDEGINEPTKITITYIELTANTTTNTTTNTDIWQSLDKTLQKNIIKKVKEILLENGFKTRIKGQEINIIEKINR